MHPLRILLGALAAAFALIASAQAGQFVEFASGSDEAGKVRLVGYLARPAGPGPFPAVVVLHGCGGFHADMIAWADRLRSWGYVALAVDSFGPRGIELNCSSFAEQPSDSFRALHYLAGQPFVRADAVAVMGFSMGGGSVLADLESGAIAHLHPEKFRAGVALYPTCDGASGIMTAPVLVLIGQLDDWAHASACEDMAAGKSAIGTSRAPGDRSMVKLIVYPGAHHGYDIAGLRFTSGIDILGHRLAYDDAATRDSFEQTRIFLRDALKH